MSSRSDPVPPTQPPQRRVRFGVFEFDLLSKKLSRNGYDLKLQQQPAQLLAYLIEKSGRLVTRDDLREAIWPTGTYVEFDFSLNSAISRLRRVLGDSAADARYIETVPKQGYRFVAPIELLFPDPRVEAGPGPQPVLRAEEPEAILSPAARSRTPLLIGAVAATIAAILAGVWLLRAKTEARPVVKYAMTLPATHHPEEVVISPKGDQVVYRATVNETRQLYRRFFDEEESRPIADSERGELPVFSPDGKEVAFYSRDALRIASATSTRDLTPIPSEFDLRKAIWGEDGFIYFNSVTPDTTPAIFRVAAKGGTPEVVLKSETTDRGTHFVFPQQRLPGDPPRLLYSTNSGPLRRAVMLLDLKTSTATTLLDRAMGGQLLPTGHLVYYWSGSLFAVPVRDSRTAGTPVEVVTAVAPNGWRGAHASISPTGTLVYLAPAEVRRSLVWVDTKGAETVLPLPPAAYEQAEVSPEGHRLAIVRRDGPDRWTAWIHDLKTGAWTKMFETIVPRPRVIWSPDGKSIVAGFAEGKSQYVNLYRIRVNAPQSPERLTEQPDAGQFPQSWSEKANAILFTEGVHRATQSDIGGLPLDGDRRARSLIATPGVDRGAAFSPDGKWFAYASDQQDGMRVYVQPYPPANSPRAVSNTQGSDPLFSRDGKRLYFLGARGVLMEAPFASGVVGAAKPAFPAAAPNFTISEDWWTRGYSLAPDGRFLVIRNSPASNSAQAQIHVIGNWFEELKKLAPNP